MATIDLESLAKAQKEYIQARDQAVQAANQAGNPQAALAAQQLALRGYLQARVKLLTQAKNNSMQQFDDAIAKYQLRIGSLSQQIEQPGQPAVVQASTSSSDETGAVAESAAPAAGGSQAAGKGSSTKKK